jgi:hypothetical protein
MAKEVDYWAFSGVRIWLAVFNDEVATSLSIKE